MSICYIVGAGEFYGEIKPRDDDLVIAADGGYDTLMRLGARCDLLLGDMDSRATENVGVETVTFPVEKDETDTHLAYLEGAKRGYTSFRVYGGVGGREDHTFANYSLLLYAKNRGHRMVLVGKGYESFVVKNQRITLTGRQGATFSVFALGGVCQGVSVAGGKYDATDVTLSPEFPLGVSNSFVGGEVTLSVRNGSLLVMREL